MKKIALLDTSICTGNNGDKIIMESINSELEDIFRGSFCVHLQTHDKIGKPSYHHINSSDYVIACGTNMLSSNMLKYNQWKINLIDSFFIKDVILLGVGWWQYQKSPSFYTKKLLNSVLNKDKLHSVRDSYTAAMLRSIGINNVINTSCPTMWKLTKRHCEQIPKEKGDSVLITLTDYNKDPRNDKKFLEIIRKNYKNIYFWIQAWDDISYLTELTDVSSIHLISPTINALNNFLSSNINVDYVGTRLHAGIKALQYKRRTIIIGIDNRAIEMSKDFNLNVVTRSELDKLGTIIESNFETSINIPTNNIKMWKNQFVGD